MGRQDIINFLKKVTVPQSVKQIAKGTGTGETSTSHTLKSMRDHGEIRFLEEKMYEYGKSVLYKYLLI